MRILSLVILCLMLSKTVVASEQIVLGLSQDEVAITADFKLDILPFTIPSTVSYLLIIENLGIDLLSMNCILKASFDKRQ